MVLMMIVAASDLKLPIGVVLPILVIALVAGIAVGIWWSFRNPRF